MIDINTPLIKAYYEALAGNIFMPGSGTVVSVYEGEEPDNLQDKAYIVLGDVVSSDGSTKSSSDTATSIQIGIYTWENKYNTALTANDIAGQVYAIIKPSPNAVLLVDGIQMLNLRVTTDRVDRVGVLAGRKYINRIIIFQQDLFIFN